MESIFHRLVRATLALFAGRAESESLLAHPGDMFVERVGAFKRAFEFTGPRTGSPGCIGYLFFRFPCRSRTPFAKLFRYRARA